MIGKICGVEGFEKNIRVGGGPREKYAMSSYHAKNKMFLFSTKTIQGGNRY